MNEKIKELECKCYDIIELDPLKTGMANCTDRIFNKQKFAEMIIQECIDTVITSYRGHLNPKIVIESVKIHFGIE